MRSLQEILARAANHPFYIPLLQTEGSSKISETNVSNGRTETVAIDGNCTSNIIDGNSLTLSSYPLLTRDHLISGTQALMKTDPTFMHGVYLSPTGGTLSVKHLYVVTDARENRAQREKTGELMNSLNVITNTDIIANLHGIYNMYQSQNLTGDLVEYSGGTHLNITNKAPSEEAHELSRMFNATVVLTTASMALQLARYMASLPKEKRWRYKKLIYTSETMTPAQEVYLGEVMGVEYIASVYGSAEGGPIAVSPVVPILKKEELETLENKGETPKLYREFVVDKRMFIMEVLDESTGEILSCSAEPTSLGNAEAIGELVMTSLCRYRNPIVRYRTGDLASLHPFEAQGLSNPDSEKARNYCICRLYGRNPLKSFNIDGEYVEVEEINRGCLSKPEWDILEWQLIIDHIPVEDLAQEQPGIAHDFVELRVVTKGEVEDVKAYEEKLKEAFTAAPMKANVKVVVKRVGYEDLKRGGRAGKMLKLVDRRVRIPQSVA